MNHRDPNVRSLVKCSASWLCAGIVAATGLYVACRPNTVIGQVDARRPAVSKTAEDDPADRETVESDDRAVNRAIFESDKEKPASVSRVGNWKWFNKPPSKASSKPAPKLNPFNRLKKSDIPHDPFVESDGEVEVTDDQEMETELEAELDLETAGIPDDGADQQPEQKGRRRTAPTSRKRLLQHQSAPPRRGAAPAEEQFDSEEVPPPAPRQKPRIKPAGKPLGKPVVKKVSATNAESEAHLRSMFEESSEPESAPEVAKKAPLSDAPEASTTVNVSASEFEDAGESGSGNAAPRLTIKTRPAVSSDAPVIPDTERVKPEGVKEGTTEQVDAETTAAAAVAQTPPETPVVTETPKTVSEEAAFDSSFEEEAKPEEISSAKVAEKSAPLKESTGTSPFEMPAPSKEPPKLEKPVDKAIAEETAEPEATVLEAKKAEPVQAPAKVAQVEPAIDKPATATITEKRAPVASANEVQVPAIRPARRSIEQPVATATPHAAKPVEKAPEPLPIAASESDESVEEPAPRPAPRRKFVPLQARANRPFQIDPPQGWSAATKLSGQSDHEASATDSAPHLITDEPLPSPEMDVSAPRELLRLPTAGRHPIAPSKQQPVTLETIEDANAVQTMRGEASNPEDLNHALFVNENSIEDEVVGETEKSIPEPVVIAELAKQNQSPWLWWMIAAFASGFAICLLWSLSRRSEAT